MVNAQTDAAVNCRPVSFACSCTSVCDEYADSEVIWCNGYYSCTSSSSSDDALFGMAFVSLITCAPMFHSSHHR